MGLCNPSENRLFQVTAHDHLISVTCDPLGLPVIIAENYF